MRGGIWNVIGDKVENVLQEESLGQNSDLEKQCSIISIRIMGI